MSNQTELRAASTLLERGVKVQIIAPLLFRVFGKRFISLKITQPLLGTYYRISALFLATGLDAETLDKENTNELFLKHGKTFAKIAAVAFLNGYWSGRLFAKPLASFLFWKIAPYKLHFIIMLLTNTAGTEDFTNTIRLVQRMKITSPNLSQKAQGS